VDGVFALHSNLDAGIALKTRFRSQIRFWSAAAGRRFAEQAPEQSAEQHVAKKDS
jgi:hypothetical protein